MINEETQKQLEKDKADFMEKQRLAKEQEIWDLQEKAQIAERERIRLENKRDDAEKDRLRKEESSKERIQEFREVAQEETMKTIEMMEGIHKTQEEKDREEADRLEQEAKDAELAREQQVLADAERNKNLGEIRKQMEKNLGQQGGDVIPTPGPQMGDVIPLPGYKTQPVGTAGESFSKSPVLALN